ncbi:phosphatase [Haloimpatiens lingqiaonensis]|uniref:phosphatase n=1 Tax=Haloimpatiens lingqiaonensis TaxID=1380675 RepID=UPI0010FF2AAD|nr:phosphatase [Haloimpatiens lingqiaonensis]
MKYISDLHTHTIVSGHAYSTLLENINEASKKGLKILGSAEHGPKMPGGPHIFYFANLKVIPREMQGVKILRGCEANIIDFEGNLDIPERILKNLDFVIASLHDVCIEPGSIEENTNAVIKVMDNPYVDIIGHPGNPSFPIYEEEIVKKAKEKNILLEINNSSFVSSRIGSKDTCSKIAALCKKYGTRIIINSDAHFATAIGDFKEAELILESVGMPEELIINRKQKDLLDYLKQKGKAIDIVID